eukprot:UN06735
MVVYYGKFCQQVMVFGTLYRISIILLRTQFYFWFLGDKIAKVKRDYRMTWKNWYYVVQTVIFGWIVSSIQLYTSGRYYWKLSHTWQDLFEIYGYFCLLQICKDVFSLMPFHRMMHEIPSLYKYHKEHHTVT